MIDSFIEQQPAIYAALLSPEVRKNEKDHIILSDTDITCAEEVLKALKPMKDATLVMSEESIPTLSIITPLHAKLVMATEDSLDDSQTVKDIKAAIAQDLGKRYANEKETLLMASTLDRFKDLPFLADAEAKETYSKLTDAVVAAIQKQQNQEAADILVEKTDQPEDQSEEFDPTPAPHEETKEFMCID
ncbi:uncharacterized protein LOC143319939 [Chaetodon auriga]|uniref:uncharacterized protein LOC143319939 n=1 Tax=Chaetodon auriga TaxID=39042 RepID=UPI004032A344